ncbi:MAG: S8 family serine peptidase [bacterium]|nr:S8 family serine peptidase [bacterium]
MGRCKTSRRRKGKWQRRKRCVCETTRVYLGDPEDEEGFSELEDPEDEEGFSELEDPEDEEGFSELEDPEDEEGFSELEDPEDEEGFSVLEDPIARRRARRRRRAALCGGSPPQRPGNTAPVCAPEQYSGDIIVRLEPEYALEDFADLAELAEEEDLPGLTAVLSEYEIESSPRVVPHSHQPETAATPNQDYVIRQRSVLEMEAEAENTDLPPLRHLAAYWRVDVRHQPDKAKEILERLNALYEVDLAYRELVATDPNVSPGDDFYSACQGYLDPAPVGIDARWAWNLPSGNGGDVSLVDLEQGWFMQHQDMSAAMSAMAKPIIHGDNRDKEGTYKGNHGTAVLGEIVAGDNAVGVVGIAPGAGFHMASHFDKASGTNGHVAAAIVAATQVLQPGDVLLLEVQKGFKPVEVDHVDFDAIRLASALGIVVVEAAGNGSRNLDAYQDETGARILSRSSGGFRESGAVMVGAALSHLPHNRKAASNYGSRIDCYAWGDSVVSCGYGDLHQGAGDHETYTASFSNTSAASPIIAGAALILQSVYQKATQSRLSSQQMRALLSDPATGTPQGSGVGGHIGVMPDLRAIFGKTLCLVPELYARDNLADAGVLTAWEKTSASPDIIVCPNAVRDPARRFGAGSGTENSDLLGQPIEPGRNHAVYVRMSNRGAGDVKQATATVFWAEPSTLITPERWNLIGTSDPVDVPQGDTLAVAGPIRWPSRLVPEKPGHYCFIAILDHPMDEAPAIPPGPPYFDFAAFLAFARDHNNVAWRNVGVIGEVPGPQESEELPFFISGTPEGDRQRMFDLEILQRLPAGAQVSLEVPYALAGQIRADRRFSVEKRLERTIRLRLPPQPCLRLCRVKLGAGQRLLAKLHVRGAAGLGHGVAVRQLYRGREVGRMTWEFHQRRRRRLLPKK